MAAAAAVCLLGLGVFLYRASTSERGRLDVGEPASTSSSAPGLGREIARVDEVRPESTIVATADVLVEELDLLEEEHAPGEQSGPTARYLRGERPVADPASAEPGSGATPEPVISDKDIEVWDRIAETGSGSKNKVGPTAMGATAAPGMREPADPTPPPPPPSAPATSPGPIAPTTPARITAEMALGKPSAGPTEGMAIDMREGDKETPHDVPPAFETEGYDRIRDNPFVRTTDEDTSTFSIDVDTASYANVRRFLTQQGRLPPKGAVRIEELLNYFPYDYAPPAANAEHPFATHLALATCPWEPAHRLARIALKGKTIAPGERPALNLVFLLDVSGSMNHANKLGLVKQAMGLLVPQLGAEDRVSIVVYAGAAGLVLPTTSGDQHHEIVAALDRLRAGGSTNGGAGIGLAYKTARASFIEGGANRVILCTDGDFNVGVSDRDSLTRLIEAWAKSGVFLSVLGFGMGNYKDGSMEELSNRGNGNYAYVDSLQEARKVLVEDVLGTLVTIAKDVKIQVFFNPKTVAGWRLIGYENRLLQKQDFNDDTKDAGEIGAGHAVTALYELVPAGTELPGPKVDPNPFVEERRPVDTVDETALFRLRLRYKQPEGDVSTLMEEDVFDKGVRFFDTDEDVQWAGAVAAFGMLLRDSPYKGLSTYPLVEEIAQAARGEDRQGYRAEFVRLVRLAQTLSGN